MFEKLIGSIERMQAEKVTWSGFMGTSNLYRFQQNLWLSFEEDSREKTISIGFGHLYMLREVMPCVIVLEEIEWFFPFLPHSEQQRKNHPQEFIEQVAENLPWLVEHFKEIEPKIEQRLKEKKNRLFSHLGGDISSIDVSSVFIKKGVPVQQKNKKKGEWVRSNHRLNLYLLLAVMSAFLYREIVQQTWVIVLFISSVVLLLLNLMGTALTYRKRKGQSNRIKACGNYIKVNPMHELFFALLNEYMINHCQRWLDLFQTELDFVPDQVFIEEQGFKCSLVFEKKEQRMQFFEEDLSIKLGAVSKTIAYQEKNLDAFFDRMCDEIKQHENKIA